MFQEASIVSKPLIKRCNPKASQFIEGVRQIDQRTPILILQKRSLLEIDRVK